MKFGLSSVSGVLSVLLLASTPMMQSCNDEEVATGAAVVAVGAAAVAIGSAVGSRNDDGCYNNYRRVCRTRWDYFGREINECYNVRCGYERPDYRPYRDYNGRRDGRRYADSKFSVSNLPVEAIVNAEEWAFEFRMSVESARRVLGALYVAKNGSTDGLRDLGLGDDDIENVALLRVPTDQGIDIVAQNLDQKPLFTKAMFSRMIVQAHNDKKELESQN